MYIQHATFNNDDDDNNNNDHQTNQDIMQHYIPTLPVLESSKQSDFPLNFYKFCKMKPRTLYLL